MKHLKTVLFLFFFVNVLYAQNVSRAFKKASHLDKNNLKIEVSDGFYILKFLNSKIIETSFIPLGENQIDKSHAVILKQNRISTKFSEDDTQLKFKTKELSIHISNAMYLNGDKATKIGIKKLDDGSRVRFSKSTNENID